MKYIVALAIPLFISMEAQAIKINLGLNWGGTMSTNCTGGGNIDNILSQVIKYLEFKFPEPANRQCTINWVIGDDGHGTHCQVTQLDQNGIPTNAVLVISSVMPYYIPVASNVFEHPEYPLWWEVSSDYGAGSMNATKAWSRTTTDVNQDLFSVLTHELVHGCLGFGTDTPYYCQTIAADLHIHVTEGPYKEASIPVNPLTDNHMHLASPNAGALLMCGIPSGGLRLLLSNVDTAAISTACRLPNPRYEDQPFVTNAPPEYIKDPNVAPNEAKTGLFMKLGWWWPLGGSFAVHRSSSLSNPNWTTMTGITVTASNDVYTGYVPSTTSGNCFFRVKKL